MLVAGAGPKAAFGAGDDATEKKRINSDFKQN